jgi:trehalose 2-sulfotransferase
MDVSKGRAMLQDITRSYTIAFTMRSGSTEICNLLARNRLGYPNEWFQKPLPAAEDRPPLDSFAAVVSQYQVEGIFGSKMSPNHRAALDEHLRSAVPGYRQLDDLLPGHRWVWLVRKNKILQAISYCRAEHSNQWASTQSDGTKAGDFPYDFFHILSRLMILQAGDLIWEIYFRERGIEPLIVVYETFFEDLDQQLPRLIDFLGGLPAGRTSVDTCTTYEPQRDEQSSLLRQRFMADLCRMGESSLASELGEPFEKWTRFFVEQQWRTGGGAPGPASEG